MPCHDQKGCRLKYIQWVLRQRKEIPIGEKELVQFREGMEEGEAGLKSTRHFEQRSVYRAYAKSDIPTVMKYGWVIERINRGGSISLLLMGFVRNGYQSYRPLHVLVAADEPLKWYVRTVYDPRSKPWKWDNHYQERICFCK